MHLKRTPLRSLAALGALLMATSIQPARAQFGGGFGTANAGSAGSASARTYPSNSEVGEAMITSDPQTRSLIIVTDDETNEQIKRVIESLDRPRPQVLINVVFLQVTHNNDLDFGVEGSYSHTAANGRTSSGGTDLRVAAAKSAFGGGFYQLVSDDVNLLINALEVEGKTEILSRPTILARNNQQATINVGQRIPIITGTTYGGINNTPINQYAYQDVGIILRVTPYINPDNTVEMIVAPEISALSSTKIDIGAGVDVPAIDNRSADTVVVVDSGKTVVIGGLIATQNIESVSKVPLLGDIPGLGWAFKRKQKKATKTELIILLTPTVMQRPSELAKVSLKETQKLQMAPEVFDRMELNRFIEGYGEEPMEEPATQESESMQDLRRRAQELMRNQESQMETGDPRP